ncbi:MAG: hypothetical protein RMJ59_01435 [Candidatus Nitrosocaldus sp.]|nr:hypothetical protein [Candidatus Nitrosocaldus sp.]MDW8275027.1 hypothetical protein [Candidatus Nitrosocaldus sp.]
MLVEVKSCNLSISDMDDIARQFDATITDYNIGIERIMKKIILHEGKRCYTGSIFTQVRKQSNMDIIYEDQMRYTRKKKKKDRYMNPTYTLYDLIMEAYGIWRNRKRNSYR